jgi:type III secretory pathway component EscT
MVFLTDGSLIDECAGFAVHQIGESGFGYKISSPACILLRSLLLC